MEEDRINLLFLSVLIIALNFVEIKFQEINILGNSATISNPFSIKIIIELVWLYFLYRYYQFFTSNKPFGLMETFNEKVDEYSKKTLHKTLFKRLEREEVKLGNPQYSKLQKEDLWYYKYSIGVQDGMGGYEPDVIEVKISKRKFLPPFIKAWSYVALNDENFSEYILPFIIAFSSFITIIYQIFQFYS